MPILVTWARKNLPHRPDYDCFRVFVNEKRPLEIQGPLLPGSETLQGLGDAKVSINR